MNRAVQHREGVGVSAGIAQARELRFARISIDRPCLIVVRRGTKILRAGAREWVAHAGEAIALAGGRVFDVTNRVSPSGAYEARCLLWDADLIEAHAGRAASARPIDEAVALKGLEPAFFSAFDAATQAIGDAGGVPLDIARHRLAELLIWMELRGVRFASVQPVSPAERVRHLVGTAPQREWTTAEVASRLALSETTLRRRLAEERTTFAEILIDVRMTTALSLLQSTDRPISDIAFDVGYASPSRFAVRFRSRFGASPRMIRTRETAEA